jgi:acyl-coenzyme A synthetase/AMP-(fatty) acid ligase
VRRVHVYDGTSNYPSNSIQFALTAEALIAYCRTELPKTNVGKILRRALRDELKQAS